MKAYKFHSINGREAIGVTRAASVYEAACIFAERKRLELRSFLNLFNVTLV